MGGKQKAMKGKQKVDFALVALFFPFSFLNTQDTKPSALICGNIHINKTTAPFSTFFHPHSCRYH